MYLQRLNFTAHQWASPDLTVTMATFSMNTRSSLTVMPKNYVVIAKRVSQGGDLILVKKPPVKTVECDTDKKKGRVCVLGPLADFVSIKGGIMRIDPVGCQPKDGQKAPAVIKSVRPSATFLYQNYKMDIVSLQQRERETSRRKKVSGPHDQQKQEQPLTQGPPLTEGTTLTEKLQLSKEPEPQEKVPAEKDLQSDHKEEAMGTRKANKASLSKELDTYLIKAARRKTMFNNVLPIQLSNISPFAVLVKWKQHPNIPCYSMMSVLQMLSTYGTIAAMGQLSINSCLVLFENFHAAVKVVRDSLIGPKAYPLICAWYYPLMYIESGNLLDIHPYRKPKLISEEAKYLRQFQDLQEQILTCLKGRGSALTYDRAAFNP